MTNKEIKQLQELEAKAGGGVMNTDIKFSVGGELDMPIYNAVDIHPQRWNGT